MDYKEICKVLGLSTKTFYNKYSGKTEYKLSEVTTLMNYYNLSFDKLITKILKENNNGKESISNQHCKQS